jgi:hypothetical protein
MPYTPIYDQNGNFVGVIRASDGANIPNDPRNADFQAFMVWYNAQGSAPFSLTTGVWSNKPARIPNDYVTMYQAINAQPAPMQNNIALATVAAVLVQNPQIAIAINAKFSINLPYDKPNT